MNRISPEQFNALYDICGELRECENWPRITVNPALLLMDIFGALGLNVAEQRDLIGEEAFSCSLTILSARNTVHLSHNIPL